MRGKALLTGIVAGLVVGAAAAGETRHQTGEGHEVHQWVALQAFRFFESQFGVSELRTFLVEPGLTPEDSWDRIRGADEGFDDGDNVIEGTKDEDTTDQNPWQAWLQSLPIAGDIPVVCLTHFCAGGDATELTTGMSYGGVQFWSAYEWASHYWTGYDGFAGTTSLYGNGYRGRAYYFLGHVAHLLTDMTVPAHVHRDGHLPLDDDFYEGVIGTDRAFMLWGYGTGVRGSPQGQVRRYVDIESVFRAAADYTEEYPSCDVWGNLEGLADNESEWPDTGRHRPDLVNGADGLDDYELGVIGDDLVPFAIEQVAALYRLFYHEVDTTPPVLDDATLSGLSTRETSPTAIARTYTFTAHATDPESGVDRDGYCFTFWRSTGRGWQQVPGAAASTGTATLTFGQAGTYKVVAGAENGGGHVGESTARYFAVTTPAQQGDDFLIETTTWEDHGDYDDVIEVGENVTARFELKNRGGSRLTDVQATLACSITNAQITDATLLYSALDPGHTEWPQGSHNVYADLGSEMTLPFSLRVSYTKGGSTYYQDIPVPKLFMENRDYGAFSVIGYSVDDAPTLALRNNGDRHFQSGERVNIRPTLKYSADGVTRATGIDVRFTYAGDELELDSGAERYPDLDPGQFAEPSGTGHYAVATRGYDFAGSQRADVVVTWDQSPAGQTVRNGLEIVVEPQGWFNALWVDTGTPEMNFGLVTTPGTPVVRALKVTNFGTAPLAVTAVTAAYADTSVTMPSGSWAIAAGGSLTATVTIDTTGKNETVTRDIVVETDASGRVDPLYYVVDERRDVQKVRITGTVTFDPPATYAERLSTDISAAGGGPTGDTDCNCGVAMGDTDGDGMQEIVVLTQDSPNTVGIVPRLHIFEKTGTNQFAHRWDSGDTLSGVVVWQETRNLAVADVTGDGKQDIVVAANNDGGGANGKLYLFQSSTNDQWSNTWSGFSNRGLYEDMATGDSDSDGKPEIIAAVNGGGVYVFESNGGTSFTETCLVSGLAMNGGGTYRHFGGLEVADSDKDGKGEILFLDGNMRNYGDGGSGNDQLFIYESTADNAYALRYRGLRYSGQGFANFDCGVLRVGDPDADGRNEIVLGIDSGSSRLWVWEVTGNDTWATDITTATPEYKVSDLLASPYSLGLSDVNGDGRPDIVVGTRNAWLLVYDGFAPDSYMEKWRSTVAGDPIYSLGFGDTDGGPCPGIAFAPWDGPARVYGRQAQVDLLVTSSGLSSEPASPTEGVPAQFRAVVWNTQPDAASDVLVRLFLGDPATGGQQMGEHVIAAIAGSSSAIATIGWTPPAEGAAVVIVVVDPDGTVAETDDSNNEASKALTLADSDVTGPAITDVVVSDYDGDGDGVIGADEQVRIAWSVTDPSGIKEVTCSIDGTPLTPVPDRAGYHALFGPLAVGLHRYQLTATDDDDSPESTTVSGSFAVVPAECIQVYWAGQPVAPGDSTDLGVFRQGSAQDCRFIVANTGEQGLRVTDVTSPMDLTVPGFQPIVVPTHGVADVQMLPDTATDGVRTGRQVVFHSSDNARAEYAVTVSWAVDGTPPAAPGGPTCAAGPVVNLAERTAGVAVAVPLGTSGAVAGDTLELLLGGASFDPVLKHKLTAEDVLAGGHTFTVGSDRWGDDGPKALSARVIDAAGNPGPEGARLGLELDSTPPHPPIVSGPDATASRWPTWTWSTGGNGGVGRYQYRLGSGAWSETVATTFTPVDALSTGPQALDVQESDANANWSASGSHTVTVEVLSLGDAVDAPQMTWSTAGPGLEPWFGQPDKSHDGHDAARSGAIGDGQSATLSVDVEAVSAAGTVSFWWRVDSQPRKDFLEFWLDGRKKLAISGPPSPANTDGWQRKAVPLPKGLHRLAWVYRKDATGSAGEDAGWVDEVAFAPAYVELLREDFEEAWVDGAPTGWSQSTSVGAAQWTAAPANDPHYASIQATAPGANSQAYLVSPWVDLGATKSATIVEFKHRQPANGRASDSVSLLYRTSSTGPWKKAASFTAKTQVWTSRTAKLPSLAGWCQIAFLGSVSKGGGVFIDDVLWYRPGVRPVVVAGKGIEEARRSMVSTTDGTDDGTGMAELAAADGGTAGPAASPLRATVLPAEPTVLDDLRCVVSGASALAEGTVLAYAWHDGPGGVLRESVTGLAEDTLPAGSAEAGTVVTCEVRTLTADGALSSAATVSPPVTIGGECVFELVLERGWNLVSLPVVPDDVRASAVFGVSGDAAVWTWTGTTYEAASSVEAGRAYWVFAAEPALVTVRGRLAADFALALAPGLNLLGPLAAPPYLPVPLPLTTEPADALRLPVWGWDGHRYGEAGALVPGRGYWLLSDGPAGVVWFGTKR